MSARLRPASRLKSVDLPTFGRPMMTTRFIAVFNSRSGPCPHPALRATLRLPLASLGSLRAGFLPEGEGLAPSGPLPLGEGGPDADPERSEGEAEGPGE